MGMNKVAGLIISVVVIWAHLAWAGEDPGPGLVINFKPGQTALDAGDKAAMRNLFRTYCLGPGGRVFVVGYADTSGEKEFNYKLSRRRAEAVRREIVKTLGIDKAIVMSLGRGSENPVADNKKARGRARNRRVEVFLINAQERKPERVYGPQDPNYKDIQHLVGEARALIKARRLQDAFQKLDQAGTLGGEHYSQWLTAKGMAGYYGNAPYGESRGYLARALAMDPYDAEAREYLSRVEACRKVAAAVVTKAMGQSEQTAIPISDPAQQYEYLRLFQVTPGAHRKLEDRPVDMWECRNAEGAPVVYYFDRSRMYAWAFARKSEAEAAPAPVAGPGYNDKDRH